MDITSPLAAFSKKYQLSKQHLLGSLINRWGEPISDRSLRELLANKMRPCETKLQQNAQNLADLIIRIHPTKNHQEVLAECADMLWALRGAGEVGNDQIGLASAQIASLDYTRTEPQNDDPGWLSKGRKLSDELETLWTEYQTALYPEPRKPVHAPDQMDPDKFLDWAHQHGQAVLKAYEEKRDTESASNLLFHLVNWTEAACSKLHRSMVLLNKIEKRWRKAVKEAQRALPAMAGKKERRTWLEFHRLRSKIALSEDWLHEHTKNTQTLEKLLTRADQDSLRWMEQFEDIGEERMFAVFQRLFQSFEIRMAMHKRWMKVVGDGLHWPPSYDPLAGFVACDSPLWPKLDSDADALSFSLSEGLDILMMPAEMKRQLFYVPTAPDPAREPGKLRRPNPDV